MLKPLHNLCNCRQKVCGILTVFHVSRVALRGEPVIDEDKLRPQQPVLSELIKAPGQAQEQLKMMGKDSRIFGKDTAPLQLVLKFVECPAAIHLHKFCFEEAFNGISGHIHCTAPPPSVEQSTGIVQTMCACLGLFAYTSARLLCFAISAANVILLGPTLSFG